MLGHGGKEKGVGVLGKGWSLCRSRDRFGGGRFQVPSHREEWVEPFPGGSLHVSKPVPFRLTASSTPQPQGPLWGPCVSTASSGTR